MLRKKKYSEGSKTSDDRQTPERAVKLRMIGKLWEKAVKLRMIGKLWERAVKLRRGQ
jgi:hypothetical protein